MAYMYVLILVVEGVWYFADKLLADDGALCEFYWGVFEEAEGCALGEVLLWLASDDF